MDTIIMNPKNVKTSNRYKLMLSLADKIDFRRSDKNIALSNINIYYTRKKIYKAHLKTINLKYQIIELPDTYYSVSDIQDYFEYITQKHETLTNTLPIITRK